MAAETGGGSGTHGQEIPQADPLAGFLGSYVGYFSGVKSYGVAGSSGFRTNVGFWHTGFSDETLRLRLYDNLGALVWQSDVTVERHDPKVVSISATVETGVLVVALAAVATAAGALTIGL